MSIVILCVIAMGLYGIFEPCRKALPETHLILSSAALHPNRKNAPRLPNVMETAGRYPFPATQVSRLDTDRSPRKDSQYGCRCSSLPGENTHYVICLRQSQWPRHAWELSVSPVLLATGTQLGIPAGIFHLRSWWKRRFSISLE